jgi:hypothetical protein
VPDLRVAVGSALRISSLGANERGREHTLLFARCLRREVEMRRPTGRQHIIGELTFRTSCIPDLLIVERDPEGTPDRMAGSNPCGREPAEVGPALLAPGAKSANGTFPLYTLRANLFALRSAYQGLATMWDKAGSLVKDTRFQTICSSGRSL